METILKITNLNKKYGAVHAVNNFSLEIKKGNIYGILGPNGSGKSTTLGMVLNVINPTSGSFTWFEGNLTTHEAIKKSRSNYRASKLLSLHDCETKFRTGLQNKKYYKHKNRRKVKGGKPI